MLYFEFYPLNTNVVHIRAHQINYFSIIGCSRHNSTTFINKCAGSSSPSPHICSIVAQREGFEPPDSCPSTVFKTAAFDRSAISAKVFCISIQIIFLLGQLTPSAKYKLNGLTRLATQQSLIRHYVPHKTAAFVVPNALRYRSAISAKVFRKFPAILSNARAVVNQICSRALRFQKSQNPFQQSKTASANPKQDQKQV